MRKSFTGRKIKSYEQCSPGPGVGPGKAPPGADSANVAGAKAPPGAGPVKFAGAKAPPGAGPGIFAGAKAPPGAGRGPGGPGKSSTLFYF